MSARPRPTGRSTKVLALDLDDTLVCSAQSANYYGTAPDFCEAIPTTNGAELFFFWERPHVDVFLRCVSQWYNLVVFTASSMNYANVLVARINRVVGRRVVKRKFFRGDCTAVTVAEDGATLEVLSAVAAAQSAPLRPPAVARGVAKDMRRLHAPLADVVLFDNSVDSFRLQPENGLLAPAFVPPKPSLFTPCDVTAPSSTERSFVLPLHGAGQEGGDRLLLDVLPFLEALSHVGDVRHVLAHQQHVRDIQFRAAP
jgi:TFIIF-interacting CTD phosphatase-like protein